MGSSRLYTMQREKSIWAILILTWLSLAWNVKNLETSSPFLQLPIPLLPATDLDIQHIFATHFNINPTYFVRFICLCTCIVIILILLAGTFVHHQLKSDDIDDKLDELKNTHIQRIRQQIDWLLTRDKEKMQTIAELRQELHDMEKQMAVLKENVKNIAEREVRFGWLI